MVNNTNYNVHYYAKLLSSKKYCWVRLILNMSIIMYRLFYSVPYVNTL